MVVNGTSVSVANNLPDALEQATGAVSGGGGEPPGGGGGGGGTVEQQVESLLAQAVQHFAAAEDALRAGDLATYQSEQEQAQALVEQANDLLAGGTGGGAIPVTVPVALALVGRQPELGIGVELGGVHLCLLEVARVVPVHRLPAGELVEHPDAGLTAPVAGATVAAEG